jgi:hypothetical protein
MNGLLPVRQGCEPLVRDFTFGFSAFALSLSQLNDAAKGLYARHYKRLGVWAAEGFEGKLSKIE